jgi:hypothetical protein
MKHVHFFRAILLAYYSPIKWFLNRFGEAKKNNDMSKIALFKKRLLSDSSNQLKVTNSKEVQEEISAGEKIYENSFEPKSLKELFNFDEDEYILEENQDQTSLNEEKPEVARKRVLDLLEKANDSLMNPVKKKTKKKPKEIIKPLEEKKLNVSESKVSISSILKMNSYGIFNRGKKSQKKSGNLLNSKIRILQSPQRRKFIKRTKVIKKSKQL